MFHRQCGLLVLGSSLDRYCYSWNFWRDLRWAGDDSSSVHPSAIRQGKVPNEQVPAEGGHGLRRHAEEVAQFTVMAGRLECCLLVLPASPCVVALAAKIMALSDLHPEKKSCFTH